MSAVFGNVFGGEWIESIGALAHIRPSGTAT